MAPFKLILSRALLLAALPLACATEVKPEFEDTGETNLPADTAGTSAGGTLATAGTSSLPKAGTTSVGGSVASNPFGGTSSSGSSSGGAASGGSASGGSASGGTASAGSATGGKAGSSSGGAGGGAGTGGAGTGGAGSGCACPKTLTWMDNTVLNWKTGDCLDVGGAKYLYTGTIAQTYANGQCNPTKQEAWCTDSGNDYKFMLCK